MSDNEKEPKMTQEIKTLSDDEFKDYLLEVIRTSVKENISGTDQLEALMITMCSISVASGINPADLLMFFARGILTMTARLSESAPPKAKKTDSPSDLDNLLSKVKRGDFKN